MDKNHSHPLNLNTMGLIGLNNVSLTDKPFGRLSNTPYDLIEKATLFKNQIPFTVDPIPAHVGAPLGNDAFLGPEVTANDLVIPIVFSIPTYLGAIKGKIGVYGFLISQRFTTNAVAAPYTLTMRFYRQFSPVSPIYYTDFSRDIQVEPTSGANSQSEFVVFSVTSGENLQYDSTLEGVISSTPQRSGYFDIPLFASYYSSVLQVEGAVMGAALIFKNQAAVPQQTSATVLVAHESSPGVIHDMWMAAVDNDGK